MAIIWVCETHKTPASEIHVPSDTDEQAEVQTPNAVPTMAPAQVWEPTKSSSPRKRRHKAILACIALLLAAYGAGALYFSTRFTPGTTVGGIDASMMSEAQLSEAIQQRAGKYTQHITDGNGFDTTIAGSDISLKSDGDKVAHEAAERNKALLWLPYLLAPQHMLIDAQTTADEQALSDLVKTAVSSYNEGAVPPTNATATYNQESGAFEVVPQSIGTALDATKVLEASTVALRGLNEEVTLGEDALVQPTVTDQNEKLLATVQQANTILSQPVEISVDDQVIATVDRDTMASWMSVTDDQELDISHVASWVEDNETLQAAGNAIDDEHVWELDAYETAQEIHRVMEQEPGTKAALVRYPLETKPPVTPGAKERGRHIDINLTTQFARFYDSDGKVIWDSYIVSGGWVSADQQMHSTPTGDFAIEAKRTNVTLMGADRDGDEKPDYESFVYYWMPFLNNDYGLHDATWRGAFGEDIRTYYGSHGCVNLPYSKAEELYGLVNVGDPVYVHY